MLFAPNIAWIAMLPIPLILCGIATIKSFTAEAYERDRVHQESDAHRRNNKRAIALSVAFQPLLGFVTTLYLGGREVLQGRLSVGTYGFMVFIVQDLLWPFTELSEIMDEYQRSSCVTLFDISTQIPC